MKLLESLINVLGQNSDFVIDGQLLKNKIIESALKSDPILLSLLATDEKLKSIFFKDIGSGLVVFDKDRLIKFASSKEFLPDSYTAFKNKVGLASDGEYLKADKNVILVWPYKDCVLEGGQSREDAKTNEIFWNETLAPDEIDLLLKPKTLTNFKRFETRDEDGDTQVVETTDFELQPTDNLLIKGNNLLALYSLKERFRGQIKLIYIDPPYNTGNDGFKYNDSFNHASWLTFMRNRLEVAKDLLSPDGVIFIQCDDNEQAYLKVLMDEIFFPENYLNTIVVQAKTSSGASGGGEDKKLKKHAEYLTFYCKDITNYNPRKIYSEVQLNHLIEDKQRLGKRYEYDLVLLNEGSKTRCSEILAGSGEEIAVYEHTGYEIKTIKQIAKEEKCDEKDVYVKYFEKTFRTQDAQSSIRHKVVSATNKDGGFYSIEYYPKSGKNKGSLTTNYYYKNELVNHLKNSAYKNAKGQVVKLREVGSIWADIGWDGIANEGGVKLKAGKKPEKLIERILNLITDEGDIVLDYHLGSGTTAAVAHKMNRQYIGIEQMDYIEDLAVQRLKNVMTGDKTGVSLSVEWKNGGSFVYCELTKLNAKFIDQIEIASTSEMLNDIAKDILFNAYITYKINPEEFKAAFEQLESIEDKKRALIEVLDKNNLYVNYTEINDGDYNISDDDKAFNKQFYGAKK